MQINHPSNIRVITLGVKCLGEGCNRTWGIRLDNYKDLMEIPAHRFVCEACRKAEIPGELHKSELRDTISNIE